MSTRRPSVQVNGKASVYNDRGQTVIPSDVRDAAGIEKGDELNFVYEDGMVYILLEDEGDEGE